MLSNLAFGGMMLAQYSRGLVSLKRIDEVIETEPDLKFNHEESNVDLKGSVEFDDVSFKYPGSSKETLSHVSFKVDPGETVGIVGRTGSGKSTLVSYWSDCMIRRPERSGLADAILETSMNGNCEKWQPWFSKSFAVQRNDCR